VAGDPAVAVNVAVEAPADTVTEVGTLTKVLFDDSATIEPPAGAGVEIVTVQVEIAPEIRLVGEHVRLDTVVAVIVSCVAADVPFNEAVSDAD
jgi:hypothetical protein